MKLKTTVKEVKENRSIAGLFNCEWEHEIKSTKGSLTYDGPLIDPEEWHRILSFFRWTYKTYTSESQVRLYVNIKERIWRGWAYPQEAKTGMTARELTGPDVDKQREQFNDPSWYYFGTVHHHCSGSAFQSSTDEYNERNQDGLHITVGSMGSAHHDLHCRFYLRQMCFDPNMSYFWDVGEWVKAQIPDHLYDGVARHQMGNLVELEFPEQWKKNIIEIPKPAPLYPNAGSSSTGFMGNNNYSFHGTGRGMVKPYHERIENALRDIFDFCIKENLAAIECWEEAVSALDTDPLISQIVEVAKDYDIAVSSVLYRMKALLEKWQTMALEDAQDELEKAIGMTEDVKQLADKKDRQATNKSLTDSDWPVME